MSAARPGIGHNQLATLAADIRLAAAASRRAAADAIAAAIQAGAKLIEAKALLPHGEWLPWLRDHAAISERSARDYMRLARSGLDIGSAADLSIRAALEAVAESDDATMPLPLPGELMQISRPWIGFQPDSVSVGIWRAADDARQFHLVMLVTDEGGHVSMAAWKGGAAATREAIAALGLDHQIDEAEYWARLTAADPTITVNDHSDDHVRKVRAVADRLAPIEDAASARLTCRPDDSGWQAVAALLETAEEITRQGIKGVAP